MGCLKLSYHSTGSPSVLRVVHSSYKEESICPETLCEEKIAPVYLRIEPKKNDQNIGVNGYVFNNPLKYTDKSGELLFAFLVPIIGKVATAIIGGAIIGAAASSATYAVAGGITGNFSWNGLGRSALYGAVAGGISGGLSAFGAMSSTTSATGQFFQKSTFGVLKASASQIGTDLIFGNKITLGGMAGAITGGLISAKLPNWKAIQGGWAANAAGEIAHNSIKGGIVGLASGAVGAAVNGEDVGRGAIFGLRNGALGGFAQSAAMVATFGATYKMQMGSRDLSGVNFRRGGVYQSIFNREVTWGNNIVTNSETSMSTYSHELVHYDQYLRLGWANFQGRGIYEQFLNSIFGVNVYDPSRYEDYLEAEASYKQE